MLHSEQANSIADSGYSTNVQGLPLRFPDERRPQESNYSDHLARLLVTHPKFNPNYCLRYYCLGQQRLAQVVVSSHSARQVF